MAFVKSHSKASDWWLKLATLSQGDRKKVLDLWGYEMYIVTYYIDRSVLLENTPLVKFIRNYIRDPSGIFSISSLVRVLITSFPTFSRFFVKKVGKKTVRDRIVSLIIIKKKESYTVAWRDEFYFLVLKTIFAHSLHSLVKYCFVFFYHSLIKFISSRRRVISIL